MSDPISTPLMAKVLTGLGGLIGGVSFMAFYKPCNVWDAAIRSGLSVLTAIVFSPVLLEWIKWAPNPDNMIAASVIIGFGAWSILSFTAHTLIGLQDEKVGLRLPKKVFKQKD